MMLEQALKGSRNVAGMVEYLIDERCYLHAQLTKVLFREVIKGLKLKGFPEVSLSLAYYAEGREHPVVKLTLK